MKVLVIHGPNLNMLGKREPEIYGTATLEEIDSMLADEASRLGVEIETFQSNSEGELVSKIQNAMGDASGLVINPAAYTHTSVALRDAITAAGLPTVEIHISNVFKREEFRHNSFISSVAIGVISGLGINGYGLALNGLVHYLKTNG